MPGEWPNLALRARLYRQAYEDIATIIERDLKAGTVVPDDVKTLMLAAWLTGARWGLDDQRMEEGHGTGD